MKKVCVVVPSLRCGGLERVATLLCGFLSSKEDLEVHLLILTKFERFYPVSDRVKIHEPNFNHQTTSRFISFFKLGNFCRSELKKINPDFILSFGERYNSFVLLFSLGLKYPVFVSDRSNPKRKLGALQYIARKCLYPLAEGIISQTEMAKKSVYQTVRHKNIKVIANPILSFDAKAEKENIILNVGRMISSKRQDLLLHFFSKILLDGWKIVMIGDGPRREFLEKQAAELDIRDHVIFLGNCKHIETYYQRSKIFAFTSSSEGFPNVLGEAMGAGLGVISFSGDSGADLLISDAVSGVLIEEGDMEGYQKALQELMVNEEKRKHLGDEAKKAVSAYSLENIGEQYLSFLLSSKRDRR